MSNSVPEGWSYKRLHDVGRCIRGLTYSPDDLAESGLLVLRSSNIQDGQLSFTDNVYVDLNIADEFLTKKGDILICVRNGSKNLIGKSVLVKADHLKSTHGAFMTVFRGAQNDFVQYLIQSDKFFQYVSRDIGATINSINNSNLLEYKFLFPPRPEQQKIAAILSSVDDVIKKTREQIDKLKDLKTGMMQELLTKGIGHTEFKDSPVGRIPLSWDPLALGDVFDLKNGVNKDKTAFGHGVPIISYKNVYSGGGIVDSDINGLVQMTDLELSRFRVNYGDVFFTRTSETPEEIGFANVYLGIGTDVVFNGFVIRGRQKQETFDPHFMKYIFQSNYVRKQMMDNSKFTTRAGISGEALNKIVVAIPSISEQVKLSQVLGSIDSRIDCLMNKLRADLWLKKALMQDLLTGKVRVEVDEKEKEPAVA